MKKKIKFNNQLVNEKFNNDSIGPVVIHKVDIPTEEEIYKSLDEKDKPFILTGSILMSEEERIEREKNKQKETITSKSYRPIVSEAKKTETVVTKEEIEKKIKDFENLLNGINPDTED